MKRILSTLLVAAMLLSLVIVATVPAAAVDGAWTVYGTASQYDADFDGDPKSLPGYEYTDDGFAMTAADWTLSNCSPFATLQTKEPVHLKDGVYMLIRVDDFTYQGDMWFNLHIWDRQMIEPGSRNYGEGVQNLIRPSYGTEENPIGKVSTVQWFYGPFDGGAETPTMSADATRADENGKPLMALTVTWDGTTYAADINGAAAPEKVITYMNEKWGTNDEAYIGFSAQNANLGGTVAATVLKFGTDAETAITPAGDDSKEPENFNNSVAEIAPADTVPEGQPAVFMTGNVAESHLKNKPKTATGATISINDDYTVHVVAAAANSDVGVWNVDNDISYDIKDFPVMIALTKNFCTCGMDECIALESTNCYLMAGDTVAPNPARNISELSMTYDPYFIGDDSYLYFYFDASVDASWGPEGRINGIRFDCKDIDIGTAGANAFDVCYIAFFRTVEEAETFTINYLKDLGWSEAEDTTEAPTEATTEAPAEVTTEAPDVDATTEAPAEVTTEAPAVGGNEKETTKAPAEGGCGSVVGFGAIAVVAVAAACGMVAFKKKED